MLASLELVFMFQIRQITSFKREVQLILSTSLTLVCFRDSFEFLFLKMKESLCVADAEGISCVQRKGKQPTLINLPAEKKSAGSQRSFSAVASCEI